MSVVEETQITQLYNQMCSKLADVVTSLIEAARTTGITEDLLFQEMAFDPIDAIGRGSGYYHGVCFDRETRNVSIRSTGASFHEYFTSDEIPDSDKLQAVKDFEFFARDIEQEFNRAIEVLKNAVLRVQKFKVPVYKIIIEKEE